LYFSPYQKIALPGEDSYIYEEGNSLPRATQQIPIP